MLLYQSYLDTAQRLDSESTLKVRLLLAYNATLMDLDSLLRR